MANVLASFAPSTFVAGGLKDDFDGRVIECRAEFFDYQGQAPQVTAIKLVIEELESKDQFEQMYSFGSPLDFVPNDEDGGDTVVKVGTHEVPYNSSNFAFLLQKLATLGFPEDRMTSKLSFMVGTAGHWNRVPAPVRAGLEAPPDKKEKGRTNQILVLTKKLRWPWELATGKPHTAPIAGATEVPGRVVRTRTAATTPRPSTASPSASNAQQSGTSTITNSANGSPSQLDADDVAAILTQVQSILPNLNDSIELPKLKMGVFQALRAGGLDSNACNLAIGHITPVWLMDQNFMVDGATVTRMG